MVSSFICPWHNGHAPTRCEHRCFSVVYPQAVWPSRLYTWPPSLCQVFVLNRGHKRRLFLPIQNTVIPSHTIIDAALNIRNFQSDRSVSNHALTGFPTHARGLTTVRFEAPIRRFINVVEARIVELGNKIDAAGGTLEMELMRRVVDIMFDGMSGIHSHLIDV